MSFTLKKIRYYILNTTSLIVGISTLILFFFSSLRHALFQSGALDLGFFDQGIYLLSQGLVPNSSIIDIHLLADHAAFILYPISFLYRIYPDIHWLFLIQAITISIGIIPILNLSFQQGLTNKQSYLSVIIYLLSPIIFNANSTYDFHPDIFIVPLALWAVLYARQGKVIRFYFCIVGILSCKAVFSLTVIALGIWLILFEKKRFMGVIAIIIGILWILISTQIIMPMLGGDNANPVRHLFRYSSLGNSYSEILLNFILKPNLLLVKVFSTDSLIYLLLLFAPFIWCFRYANLNYLIPAIPTIAMNILSTDPQQRYLANHYPLPILPFLILMAIPNIASFTSQKKWGYKFIIFWAVLSFVTMSRLNLFAGEYLATLDTRQATNEAISMVKTKGSLLTTHEISPHLTHRPEVRLAFSNTPHNLEQFDYILLNTRYPGYRSDSDYALSLVDQAKKMSSLKLEYQKDDVYLFIRPDL